MKQPDTLQEWIALIGESKALQDRLWDMLDTAKKSKDHKLAKRIDYTLRGVYMRSLRRINGRGQLSLRLAAEARNK